MKTLEARDDKIQQICDALKKETLEPAQKQADQIIEEARKRAEQIIQTAERESERLLKQAQAEISQQHKLLRSSLEQAAKQGIESLKQAIEQKLFNPELHALVTKSTIAPQVISDLIVSLIQAIDKEGLAVNLSVFIPKTVSVKEINALLTRSVLAKINNGSVAIGDFNGGIKIRWNEKKMTLDITDEEIAELLGRYVRKDFRKHLFA